MDKGWQLTGARHVTADEIAGANRNAYSLVPGAGQAASHPPEVRGVRAHNEGHSQQLDGHPNSEIASHPDGQFAMNTAATSEYSSSANARHYYPTRPRFQTLDARTSQYAAPPRDKAWTTAQLLHKRDDRLEGSWDSEVMVKTAQHERSRRMSFLAPEVTAPQLGLGALGLYLLVR